MAKSFGEVVKVVRGPVSVLALVAQSVVRNGEESLTVVYLDPSKASPLLSGQSVDNAIKKDFVVPLSEGKTFGWEELIRTVPYVPALDVNEAPAGTDFESALKKAGGIITEQAGKITALQADNKALADELESIHAKLAEVEKELSQTTEGIDKQLQALADENAVKPKEAAPEAPADPTSSDSTSSTSLSSDLVEPPKPSEIPAPESTPQSSESGTE